MAALMDFLRSIMQFVEANQRSFPGSPASRRSSAPSAEWPCNTSATRKNSINASMKSAIRTVAKNSLEASLNHEAQESAKLHDEIGQLKEEFVVEKIQHEVDVHYQKEERA